MIYRVWCEVSGGVTGSRGGWLKSNGVIRDFHTREEAEEEARKCREMPRYNSTAHFRYTVREEEEEKPLPRKEFNALIRKLQSGEMKLSDIVVPPPGKKKEDK